MKKAGLLYRIFFCMAVMLAALQLVDDACTDTDYISMPGETELCCAEASDDVCLQPLAGCVAGTLARVMPLSTGGVRNSSCSRTCMLHLAGAVSCPQPSLTLERRSVFCVYRI